MSAHHAGDADKELLLARNFFGQRYQARQSTRNLDDSHFIGTTESIYAIETHDEIQGLVRHLREWVRGVQPHRHQQGLNFTQKIFTHPFALRGIAFAVRYQTDGTLVQRRNDGLVVDLVLARYQFMSSRHQRFKAGAGINTFFIACFGRRHMRRAAHLKPFVEIGRNNAQIAQALQQRHVFALGPTQHTLVEHQNAVVAVQQFRRRQNYLCWRLRLGNRHTPARCLYRNGTDRRCSTLGDHFFLNLG